MAGVAGRGLAVGHVSSLRPVLVFVSLREVIGRSGSSSVTLPQAPPTGPLPPSHSAGTLHHPIHAVL